MKRMISTVMVLVLLCLPCLGQADQRGVAGSAVPSDRRIRAVPYDADRIYRLHGYVGYQIDLEFEAGEAFVGLGAGDIDGLGFAAQDNHLFIKPKASKVRTNLTILTTRRTYHFDYEVTSAAAPDEAAPELIYAMRFAYTPPPSTDATHAEGGIEHALQQSAAAARRNRDYWYCGSAALLPLAAFDDGVHTHLRFNPGGELPALFVRNDDGSESLLNFSVQDGEVVIHRLARQFLVRRGNLKGCIVNRSFGGNGRELQSGTITPSVERSTRELRR